MAWLLSFLTRLDYKRLWKKPNVLDCILQLQVSLKTLTLHGRGTSAEPLLFSRAVHLKGALPPSGLTPPGGLAGYLKN